MLHSDSHYTKLRWLLTIAGLLLYVVDIWTDVGLALKYFQQGDFVWTALTLGFVLAGMLVTQIFSFSWYIDDMNNVLINADVPGAGKGLTKGGLVSLHLFGLGVFTRYYYLLKKGFSVVWTTDSYTVEERSDVHHRLFCLATDLSMLKLFEAFLESAPQLLLQLYITLGHEESSSVMQYISMAFSFFNIAWALVDYRRCLRRSLPHVREMPSGLPTAVYLLYKLCTITSHILSYSLLLILCPYSLVALTFLWLLGIIWTNVVQTNFCSSKKLEILYRAVIAVILAFTFFNVKGQDTKMPMIFYYLLYTCINTAAPLLLVLLRPELQTAVFLLTVSALIFIGSVLGLLCLTLYYVLLHPREKWREADEVDSLEKETETTKRIRNFLKP